MPLARRESPSAKEDPGDALADHVPALAWAHDASGRLTHVNPAWLAFRGRSRAEEIGRRFDASVHPADRAHVQDLLAEGHAEVEIECRMQRADGAWRWMWGRVAPRLDAGGKRLGSAGACLDVTDRRRAEKERRRAVKMDALERLAGGLAHDVSNVLMVMMGHASLSLPRLGADDPLRKRLEEILRAGDRAAALTGRLLAFSRKPAPVGGSADLATALDAMEDTVRRLVGDEVAIATEIEGGLPPLRAEGGQLTEVVTNLASNARDAMPRGGRLTISATRASREGSGPGVLLRVTDTGEGMSPETVEHLFEPYFTTKGKGRGAGLGLAMVYGIVHQCGGHVEVASEPGKGTTVSAWFPLADAAPAAAAPLPSEAWPRGDESVLLVEDEASIRATLAGVLRDHGYEVMEAGDGEAALRAAEAHAGRIHLLVTDVAMPGMTGPEVARRLAAKDPSLAVLFVSGTAGDLSRSGGGEAWAFLRKPFTPDVFLRKVRDVLGPRSRRR
jgi:PAS domain S-box-containing protein